MTDHTPDPVAWDSFRLEVGDGHVLHVEQAGRRDGLPAVCLHGGPASGMSIAHRRFFDPARYRIIQFDQRGSGRSAPRGHTGENTTAHLIADIERLRQHLGIERWLVFGGSWGATLALAYAGAHPAACMGVVLRGLFLGGADEIQAFFDGHRQVAPEAHELLAQLAPPAQRARLAEWVPAAMLGDDVALQGALSRAWQAWEAVLDGGPVPDLSVDEHPETVAARIDKYRVQAHYLAHACFLAPGWWQPAARALGALPVALIHGRDDRICAVDNSRVVHPCCHDATLIEVAGCRHNPFEPQMEAAIRATTDRFARRQDFGGAAAPPQA
jgi:proline iminopeptidase